MENLLCNEVWLMSPNTTIDHQKHANKRHRFVESYTTISCNSYFYTTMEDCEEAFQVSMKKEMSFMHEPSYVNRFINLNDSINIGRSKAIHWLIQSRSRLNLCFGTVSNAANYFDRFFSAIRFNGWNCWVIELVSVACLSIASKFGETAPPPLNEIQMQQGLDHSFESRLIQRMELTVLNALDWRLICTTPFSYVELMTWNITDLLAKPFLVDHLMDRLNDLLLGALIDCEFLAFRPSVVAVSALKCVLEELLPSSMCEAHLSNFSILIPHDQKENLTRCHKMMEERLMYNSAASMYNYPSSPVTVLSMERVHISDGKVDFSLFKNKKRKIEQE